MLPAGIISGLGCSSRIPCQIKWSATNIALCYTSALWEFKKKEEKKSIWLWLGPANAHTFTRIVKTHFDDFMSSSSDPAAIFSSCFVIRASDLMLAIWLKPKPSALKEERSLSSTLRLLSAHAHSHEALCSCKACGSVLIRCALYLLKHKRFAFIITQAQISNKTHT